MEESVIEKSYVRVTMALETTNSEELRRIIDNHIDYLLDLEVNTDIQSVEDVISYDVGSNYIVPKVNYPRS